MLHRHILYCAENTCIPKTHTDGRLSGAHALLHCSFLLNRPYLGLGLELSWHKTLFLLWSLATVGKDSQFTGRSLSECKSYHLTSLPLRVRSNQVWRERERERETMYRYTCVSIYFLFITHHTSVHNGHSSLLLGLSKACLQEPPSSCALGSMHR